MAIWAETRPRKCLGFWPYSAASVVRLRVGYEGHYRRAYSLQARRFVTQSRHWASHPRSTIGGASQRPTILLRAFPNQLGVSADCRNALPLQFIGGKGDNNSLLIGAIPVCKGTAFYTQCQGAIVADCVRPKECQTSLDDGFIFIGTSRIAIVGCKFGNIRTRLHKNKPAIPLENHDAVIRPSNFDRFAIGSVGDRDQCSKLPTSFVLSIFDIPCAIASDMVRAMPTNNIAIVMASILI